MSAEMVTVKKTDLEFVRAYCNGLEGMKTLLTRERDEARDERDAKGKRIADLEKQLTSANDRLVHEDMARHKPETIQDYVEAFAVIDPGQTAYEAHEALPGVRQAHRDRDTKSTPWPDLKESERHEWRAIGGAVVASFTDNTKPTKPLFTQAELEKITEYHAKQPRCPLYDYLKITIEEFNTKKQSGQLDSADRVIR